MLPLLINKFSKQVLKSNSYTVPSKFCGSANSLVRGLHSEKKTLLSKHGESCMCGCRPQSDNGNKKMSTSSDNTSHDNKTLSEFNNKKELPETTSIVDEFLLNNLHMQQAMIRELEENEEDDEEDRECIVEKNRRLQEEIDSLRAQLELINPHSIQSSLLQEDPDIALLLDNNRKWVEKQKKVDEKFFKRIGGVQKPKYLYIGCSDSRVPANQILGLKPGEVFVHRNVGNQVIGNDLNVLSGIEFAVNVLNVKHIIVTGHYDCGAIKAAGGVGKDLGLLENWLRSLRDIYRMHYKTLDIIEDEHERHKKFVEISVVEQCLNLYKTGVVQRKRKETHSNGAKSTPRIHAMVFDPKVGLLNKLPIDFKSSVGKFRHIYDLY